MKRHLAGKASPLYVEFQQEGEFVIPDVGSVFLTIRNTTGLVLAGYDALAIPGVILSTFTYAVPQAVNVIGVVDFETRYVRFDFRCAGKPLVMEQVYQLSNFVPLTATPAEVRSLFGARDRELPDSDIDLLGGYFALRAKYPTEMVTALTGVTTAQDANRAVVLTTGLQLFPSIPSRILKEEGLNNATQIRASIDWETLHRQLLAELGVVLGRLQAEASVSVVALPTPLLVLTNPIDPVTNA